LQDGGIFEMWWHFLNFKYGGQVVYLNCKYDGTFEFIQYGGIFKYGGNCKMEVFLKCGGNF
jgi:hypothetical protein